MAAHAVTPNPSEIEFGGAKKSRQTKDVTGAKQIN